MIPSFDAVVIGLGGMGSATAQELARRGCRVLGLEQYRLGHDQGSSHGGSRIIRTAYFEHPDYVPLLQRAFDRWYDLELRVGRRLLTETPCLTLGPADSALLRGVRTAAQLHQLPLEELSAQELVRRYSAFRVPSDWQGVQESQSGILVVDDCVRALQEEAIRAGADLRQEEQVQSFHPEGQGSVRVVTNRSEYRAGRLVLTAGPWAGRLLPTVPLTVMRQVVLWFNPATAVNRFRRDQFPIFIADTPEGYFYGIPALDRAGLKVAQHYGAAELPHPEAVDRTVSSADEVPVREFLTRYLPEANGTLQRSSICLYTLTPDRHFVLDVHSDFAQIVIGAGFSGHGFKFAPVVGEILADLALSKPDQIQGHVNPLFGLNRRVSLATDEHG